MGAFCRQNDNGCLFWGVNGQSTPYKRPVYQAVCQITDSKFVSTGALAGIYKSPFFYERLLINP